MKLKIDRNELAALIAALPNPTSKLTLVKDDGIYIMAFDEPKESRHIVYAKGYNPKVDKDVWEKSRNAMGGDDGGDNIGDRAEFEKILDASDGDIIISVTASSISTSYLPKYTPEQKAARVKALEDWLKKTTSVAEVLWTPKFKAVVKKARKELAELYVSENRNVALAGSR
jgi:hypothetical protein